MVEDTITGALSENVTLESFPEQRVLDKPLTEMKFTFYLEHRMGVLGFITCLILRTKNKFQHQKFLMNNGGQEKQTNAFT